MRYLILIIVFMIRLTAFASNADSLSTIVDLEFKITQKVKAVLEPVDPDAIVVTKVEIKKTTTPMPGTQLQAIELFATGDLQKIEDTDIDQIRVTIRSGMDPFPREIAKVIETMILDISKKGQVSFLKIEAETKLAIDKNKEYQKSTKENVQKIVEFVNAIAEKFGSGIILFAGGYALMHLLLTLVSLLAHSRAANSVGKNISNIKISSSDDGARGFIPPVANENTSPRSSQGIEVHNKENPLAQMRLESLKALLSDAYWCEQDSFAAWIWSSLLPNQKIQLLEVWEPFKSYVSFLNTINPREEKFHLDPAYLKPHDFHAVSNGDLLIAIKKNKPMWHTLSFMRRKSLALSLKDRVELNNLKIRDLALEKNPSPVPEINSVLRALPATLEVTALTEADELMLWENPSLLSAAMKRQLPSIIWVALLPQDERENYLQKIPAQSLAEVWIGPEVALSAIKAVLPEKKIELLNEYASKLTPSRSAPTMAVLSLAALDLLEKIDSAKKSEAAKKVA